MNYKIEYHQETAKYLTISARRATIKAKLLAVRQGGIFIRLGKNELLVRKGEYFWLPFDCLHAITTLPNTRYDQVIFSPRLTGQLPTSSGFFSSSLFDELLKTVNRMHSTFEENQQLLDILFQQLKYQSITLDKSDLSRALNHNIPNMDEVNISREVIKKLKSGLQWNKIASSYPNLKQDQLINIIKQYCSPEFIHSHITG